MLAVITGKRPEKVVGMPDAVSGLLDRCWDREPKRRPRMVVVCGLLHSLDVDF